MITEKMEARIDSCMEFFKNKTIDGHIIKYFNGFCGVGILEEPENHITEKANTIWLYSVGFSENGKRIVEQENILMTEDEAHDLKRCLTIALSSTNFTT